MSQERAQFVDLAVSRKKFETEIGLFREREAEHRQRGIHLLKADFPSAVIVFRAMHLPLQPVVFCVVLDFLNFDVWAPSLRFIDPFTREVLPVERLPNRLPVLKDGADGQPPRIEQLIQGHSPLPAFLCHRGVREYHEHPAHDGDSWALYRGGAEGRLARVVELIHKYGVAPMALQLNIGFGIPEPAS